MARKTKEEAQKTRSAILDSALDVFYEKGFSRTTLDDIARKAGVTRGAIYWHFSDKAEVFKQLSESIENQFGMKLDDMDTRAENLEEIQWILTEYFKVFKDPKYCKYYEISNYKTEWMGELRDVLESGKVMVRKVIKALCDDFEYLQKKGKVKPDIDPQLTAIKLAGMVEGVIQIWFFSPDIFELQSTAAKIFKDFFNEIST